MRFILNKKTKRRERAHQTVKERRIDTKFCCDRLVRLRDLTCYVIKYTEFGARIKNLAAPTSVNQVKGLVRRLVHRAPLSVAGSTTMRPNMPLCPSCQKSNTDPPVGMSQEGGEAYFALATE